MSESSSESELLRLLCEQRGLRRALKLFPDGVKAAVERGMRPLGDPPPGNSPIAAPAPIFDPVRFEQSE